MTSDRLLTNEDIDGGPRLREIVGPHDPPAHDQPVEWCWVCRALHDGLEERIAAALATARLGLLAVANLINHSNGVAGLHMNGRIALWDDLRTGGEYEAWLAALDDALMEMPPAERSGARPAAGEAQEREGEGETR